LELKDFVKNALTDIMTSVREAAAETRSVPEDGLISPRLIGTAGGSYMNVAMEDGLGAAFLVEFDLSIVVTETDQTRASGGAKLTIMSFFSAGAERTLQTQDGQVSAQRIKFSVPVKYPQTPKPPASRYVRP